MGLFSRLTIKLSIRVARLPFHGDAYLTLPAYIGRQPLGAVPSQVGPTGWLFHAAEQERKVAPDGNAIPRVTSQLKLRTSEGGGAAC